MRLQLSLLLIIVVSGRLLAEKARAWQTGKVVDSARSQYQSGTNGSVDYGTPGYSERTVYGKVQTLVIEGADYIYTIQEDTNRPHLSVLPPKLTNLTVNAPIRYAVEKQKIYLIDEDGKEHKMDIIKRVLITKP